MVLQNLWFAMGLAKFFFLEEFHGSRVLVFNSHVLLAVLISFFTSLFKVSVVVFFLVFFFFFFARLIKSQWS